MKRTFRSALLFLRSFPTVILFELIFKLMLTSIGAPLFSILLEIAMKRSKISYLTTDNIGRLLKNPFTWLILILMLFVLSVLSITELSGLVGCYACKLQKKKITPAGMVVTGLRAFAKAFRGAGALTFVCFMLVVPIAQLTLTSGVFLTPFIPLMRRAISTANHRILLTVAIMVLEAVILFMLASRSYSIHFLVLTEKKYSDCIKNSRKALKGKKLSMAFELLLLSIFLAVMTAAATLAVGFVVMLFIKGFSRPEAAFMSALKVLGYAWQIFTIISVMISAPMVICFLTVGFVDNVKYSEKLSLPESDKLKLPTAVRAFSAAVLIGVGVFLNFSYIKELYRGNVRFAILSKPQLSAHRGFSAAAPENTCYAFEEAIRVGADYIELDVQQTADGEIVVIHDDKLDRTTDGKGKVINYTYEELQQFSCGKWFGKAEYYDAKIMLLSEVLELCRDEIMLNIEIKKAGDSVDTANKVVELLNEYDMTDRCYITSFSYKALKAAKQADPSIRTGLIATLATSAVYSNMKYIDAISINYVFADKKTVSTAHKNGKKVFVWTVDNSEDVERMTALGVDNIITNRPDKAAKAVYSYGVGDYFLTLLENLFSAT